MDILIIKTGALGDVLRTSFIAEGLKAKYGPGTCISWLVSSAALPLISSNPFIDRLFVESERDSLLGESFDLVINLEEDLENTNFLSSCNASEKIGFLFVDDSVVPTPTTKRWFDMSLLGAAPQNDILKRENRLTHNELISEIVGLPSETFFPMLPLDEAQKLFVDSFCSRNSIFSSDLVVGVNVGSSARWKKQLPVDKTVSLIESLRDLGLKVILFGGSGEVSRNREIMSHVASLGVIDPGCGLSLDEYVALASRCNLSVCSDTLGLHVFLALGIRTVALIGPTSSAEIGMCGLGSVVNPRSNCLCCYSPDCTSMDEMDVNDILVAVNTQLEKLSL